MTVQPHTGPARGRVPVPRRRRGNRAGQVLVEMLFVLPILLLLAFGIVELGALWRTYQVVTNTAREGARLAVVANGATYEEVRDAIDQRLANSGLDPGLANVEFRCEGATDAGCFTGGRAGEPTEVWIAYPYTFFILGPIVRYSGGDGSAFGTVTMQTTFVMRNE